MINAFEYGKALFLLAKEEEKAEQIMEQICAVSELMKTEPDYCKLLDTPAIATNEKPKLIDEAFKGVHIYVLNFLKMLCQKKAIGQFDECVKAYLDCYDESKNIMRAVAVTARPMSERQTKALREKLELITGKAVVLKNEVDQSLIGGVSLRYDGKQFDGSIKSRLDTLKSKLSETIV